MLDDDNTTPIKVPTPEIEDELAELLEAGLIHDTGERQLDLKTGKLVPIYEASPSCFRPTEEELKAEVKAMAADGLLRDTGQRKRDPRTGEMLIVWELTELGRQLGLKLGFGKRTQ